MNKIDELWEKNCDYSEKVNWPTIDKPTIDKPTFIKLLAEYEQNQWHYLRDNPEDLPNDTNDRYCAYKLRGRIAYKLALYYKANKEWYDIGSNKITPIAWREPPKWEKN